jgi:RNA polymerase sigma-70 factor (ECF subfamily)
VASTAEFESLLAPLLDRAYGVALHLTRDRADAEDLVQEAALLAFRGFKGFRPGTNFRAWFFRILTNAFFTAYRRRKHEPDLVSLDEVPSAYIQRRAHEVVSGEEPGGGGLRGGGLAGAVLGKLEVEQMEEAIMSLPEEFRVACSLYFLQDFAYQEIADVIGVPIGTVRSRLHRGRALLQKRLWRLAEDHGLVTAAAAAEGRAP